MKKILVTGGCGYIGSHTIVTLLQKGYEVISIDNLDRAVPDAEDRIKKITGKTFRNYRNHLSNIRTTRAVFKEHADMEGIIHFAAYKQVGESVERPLKYYTNNLTALINVLICLRESLVPNFIFSSSSAVYGNVSKLPVNEGSPVTQQTSPYGRSKYFSEKMIEDLCHVHPFKALMLRYFNPAGVHESGLIGEKFEKHTTGLMPSILAAASGKTREVIINGNDYPTRDGTCIRDYIHVMDVADAHVAALEFLMKKDKTAPYMEAVNIGTGTGVSVLEMVKAFESVNGISLPWKVGPRRPGDIISVYSDNSKAWNLLNWHPSRDVEEIMRSAWKWEMANSQMEEMPKKDNQS